MQTVLIIVTCAVTHNQWSPICVSAGAASSWTSKQHLLLIWNKLLAPDANSELELFKNPHCCNPDRDCSEYFNGTKAIVENRASVENGFAAPLSYHPLLHTSP